MKVEGEKISFSYEDDTVFAGIDLEVISGKVTSIVGPNGVGKSTLVKCLCNIYSPDSGGVYLDGNEISAIGSKGLAKTLGYVPQSQINTFSVSVYEAVLMGRRPYIKWRVTDKDEEIVNRVLERMNITSLAEREVTALSGGEQQKVAIARALAQEPEVIFLDEPTSNLDINHQLEVMEILSELAVEDGTTVIIVMHDLNLASRFSDYSFLLNEGGIYSFGSPKEVFTVENIKATYGVEVEIIKSSYGLCMIPIGSKKLD